MNRYIFEIVVLDDDGEEIYSFQDAENMDQAFRSAVVDAIVAGYRPASVTAVIEEEANDVYRKDVSTPKGEVVLTDSPKQGMVWS